MNNNYRYSPRKSKSVSGKLIFVLLLLLVAITAAVFFFLREPVKEALAPYNSPAPSVTPTPSPSPTPSLTISFEVTEAPHAPAKYIFLMIGDGMGEAQRSLAQSYAEYIGNDSPLIMNSLPVSGAVTTKSLNRKVTDSAAAATAYATGQKTNNGMLSVTPDGNELKTIMEAAEENGLSTGLVTTTTLTNATPAAFASHEENRSSEADIALSYLNSGVDFFAGGGANYFLPSSYSGGPDALGKPLKSSRGDNTDVVSDFEDAGYKTFIGQQGAVDFTSYVPSAGDKVLAAFTNSYMPYELDRVGDALPTPSLAKMTQTAILALESDEEGFVLMVEGGRIDHVCADTDPTGAVFETLSFNDAVQEAYSFYTKHPEETLIIVVGDHETGGLSLKGSLDLTDIAGIKLSIPERLHLAYTDKDRKAYYEYLSANFGLDDLNPSEKKLLEKALDFADGRKYKGEYPGSPASVVADIFSKRIGVKWAGKEHTGVPVPLYAVGLRAEDFSGNIDNTDVGKKLFDIIGS